MCCVPLYLRLFNEIKVILKVAHLLDFLTSAKVLRECESERQTNIFEDLSEIEGNTLTMMAAFKEAESCFVEDISREGDSTGSYSRNPTAA